MKKLIVSVLALVLLAGCTSGQAKLTDGSEVLISVNGQNVTKNQVFNVMLESNGANQVIGDALEFIADQEIEVTEQMTQDAQSSIDMQKMIYGDNFEVMLKNAGYTSAEDYINKVLMPNLKIDALITKYINNNFETIATTYKPRQIQVMTFKEEETAINALNAVLAGTDFVTVGTENKSSTDPSVKVATIKSTYPLDVKIFIEQSIDGTISEVMFDEDSSTYYIVKIISTDPNAFQDEAAKALLAIADIEEEALSYYLNQYDFQVYDEMLYNTIKANYPDYIK